MQLLRLLMEMSSQELRTSEDLIARMFRDLSLDVIWSTHFKERAQGREENVSMPELVDAFSRMKKKYGPLLQAAKENHEQFSGVLKDLATDLNIPFAIDFNQADRRNSKYHLRGITIMRKDPSRFHINAAGGQELTIESSSVEDRDADGIVKDEYGVTPAIGVKKRGKGINKRWGGMDPQEKRISNLSSWLSASDSA